MTEITVDLPMPPSVNRLWTRTRRGMGMVKSKQYVAWIKEADGEYMAAKEPGIVPRISGEFEVTIFLQRGYRGDGDNRIKALLDWAQSREIISNDINCVAGNWAWVDEERAPKGARMILQEIGDERA